MEVGLATDRGAARERNEDACAAGAGFLAVADGMGGHRAGEVAAALALASVQQALPPELPVQEAVRRLFARAQRTIQEEARRRADRAGMGTTLTAAWLVDGRAVIGHVGDSRAYLVRDGRAWQLTEDHSVVAELVRNGSLSAQEALQHPHRHVLTRSLGGPGEVEVDVVEVPLQAGDRLVLCTDGVSTAVTEAELARVVGSAASAEAAAQALVQLAAAGGSADDMTAVVAFIGADDLSPTDGADGAAGQSSGHGPGDRPAADLRAFGRGAPAVEARSPADDPGAPAVGGGPGS